MFEKSVKRFSENFKANFIDTSLFIKIKKNAREVDFSGVFEFCFWFWVLTFALHSLKHYAK